MSIVKPDRVRSRLAELEHAVQSLSLRVRQLQREVATPSNPTGRRAKWSVWLESLVGSRRLGSYAPTHAMVRENRRVHRHAIHARQQTGV